MYRHYNDFLDVVDNYETELDENRATEANKIANKYLIKPKPSGTGSPYKNPPNSCSSFLGDFRIRPFEFSI